jgi:hypothetical protein
MALPTILDITDPASNLAALDAELAALSGLDASFMPAILSENRFLYGADIVPAMFLAAYGFRRSRGSIAATLLWGLAGYMAPLPVASVVAYETVSGQRAFAAGVGGLSGGQWFDIKTKRCIRWHYVIEKGRGRVRRCQKYAKVH